MDLFVTATWAMYMSYRCFTWSQIRVILEKSYEKLPNFKVWNFKNFENFQTIKIFEKIERGAI